MRDVDRVFADAVVQAVSFGHATVFIQQKQGRNRMLLQKLYRLEKSFSFFRCDVHHLRSRLLEVIDERLKLGHAFHAVWSPGAAQEFQHHPTRRDKAGERKDSFAICRCQREIWGERANSQRLSVIQHPVATLKDGIGRNNSRRRKGTSGGTGREAQTLAVALRYNPEFRINNEQSLQGSRLTNRTAADNNRRTSCDPVRGREVHSFEEG